jgi:hypothetical protein
MADNCPFGLVQTARSASRTERSPGSVARRCPAGVDEAGDGKAVDFGVLRKPYRKADIARAMLAALAV